MGKSNVASIYPAIMIFFQAIRQRGGSWSPSIHKKQRYTWGQVCRHKRASIGTWRGSGLASCSRRRGCGSRHRVSQRPIRTLVV